MHAALTLYPGPFLQLGQAEQEGGGIIFVGLRCNYRNSVHNNLCWN